MICASPANKNTHSSLRNCNASWKWILGNKRHCLRSKFCHWRGRDLQVTYEENTRLDVYTAQILQWSEKLTWDEYFIWDLSVPRRGRWWSGLGRSVECTADTTGGTAPSYKFTWRHNPKERRLYISYIMDWQDNYERLTTWRMRTRNPEIRSTALSVDRQ